MLSTFCCHFFREPTCTMYGILYYNNTLYSSRTCYKRVCFISNRSKM